MSKMKVQDATKELSRRAAKLLGEMGALIMTGPTGTNVNDLYVALKR